LVDAARIDRVFEAWDNAAGPGCAVGIYENGEPAYLRGYGAANLEHGVPNTPATVFHIASLSKQFTAFAVGLLANSGELSLDDPLRKYIPELPAALPVTFRQAIHHVSGLRDQWDLLRLGGWRHADLKTNDDILALAVRQRAFNFASGSRFQYINTGYTLMGIAVGRVTGMSLREYAAKNIFEPLGMRQTWFHDHYNEIVPRRAEAYSTDAGGAFARNMPAYETVGPTGLFSTVEDFARWERNFLHPVVGDAEFIQRMTLPVTFESGHVSNYGFGLISGAYRGLPTAEHAGGDAGFRSHFLRFPGQRLAIAIFCNISEMKPGELARRVADVCLEGRFEAEERDLPAWAGRAAGVTGPPLAELESRCGIYRDSLSGMTCRIELRGVRLVLIGAGASEYELVPMGRDRLQFTGIDAECIFDPVSGRMAIRYAGQQAADCERTEEESVDLNPAPLSEYPGAYYSAELDVRYRVELVNGSVVLHRPKYPGETLDRLSGDEFSSSREGFHIRFVKNGMVLNAERVWNLAFDRLV
jgi:CubicO group peptidase (beta-lactamase class C family)